MRKMIGREQIPPRTPTICAIVVAALITCIFSLAEAQEPSPAGGNYLDLFGDVYYLSKDNSSLDAALRNEWTIEAWIYMRKFPPIPKEGEPPFNYSCILAKPGSYMLLLESFFLILDDVKYWESDCFFERFMFKGEKIGGPFLFMAFAGKAILPGVFDGPIMDLNKWHHVAIQQHKNMLTSFFDGQVRSIDYLKREPDMAPWKMPDFDSPFYIGNIPAEESHIHETIRKNLYPFEGAIDDLRISNVARYKDGYERPKGRFKEDIHTMALWHFDEPPGSLRYEDSSGNGNTLISNRVFDVSLRGKRITAWGKIKRKP